MEQFRSSILNVQESYMLKKKILVFASGSASGGGSGFEKLVLASRGGPLCADIVGVVSNHAEGGVRARADMLGVPFIHFPQPWSAESYQKIAAASGADFFALSGWLKLVCGLDSKTRFNARTVFNIHPGPLPAFGGPGMYGHHVHEAVIEAFRRGDVTHSAVSMHFVTEGYDRGPVFFQIKVEIARGDTPETLAARVNQREHLYQPMITDYVVNGRINWDGVDSRFLRYPSDYPLDWR
jgi:phosphoribosylglycinamide formyltransferase 1